MSGKDLAPEDEEKLAARAGARLVTGKQMVLSKDVVICLSGDETPITIEDLRWLRDYARQQRGA